MDEPADLRMALDSPARFFTPEEANALVPALEAILARTDRKLARHKDLKELTEDQEAYWGPSIREPTNPEHARYTELVRELQEAKDALDADVAEIRRMGCELKDPYLGLVDFYAWRGGELVYLCWQRGESRVAHWHTLEAGYAGRKPLTAGARAEP